MSSDAKIFERRLETSHASVYVQESIRAGNSGDVPVILLLHGNSFCSKIWRHIFQSDLNQTHRIIAFDYPGHGKSSDAKSPETSYNMPGYADCALQVLKQLNALSNVVVVGWSLGGHVAVEMAMRCEVGVLKGLVLTGTPPADHPSEIDKAFTFGPGGWKEAMAARNELTEEELQGFAHGCADPPYEDWMYDCTKRTDGRARELMFKQFAEGKPDPTGLQYPIVQGSGARWGQKECVEKLDIPLLVLNGKDEPFISLEWIRNINFKNLWSGTCIEMEGLLHAPFWGNPQEYQKYLEKFVRDVSP